MNKHSVNPLLITLLISVSFDTSAQIYKCTTADNRISYSQTPCPSSSDELVFKVQKDTTRLSKSSNFSNAIISQSDLIGTWTDIYPYQLGFSTKYAFSTSVMTMTTRLSGRKVSAKYTLKGDELVVHFKKGYDYKEDWDNSWSLKKFEGNELLVKTNGVHMRLTKLY